MPKNASVAKKGEDSDQFYFGENNSCILYISLILGVASLLLVIPWSIWAFTSSLWPTSEAFNPDVVIWVKVTILALFIFPVVSIFLGCALKMCCKTSSANMKQCFVLAATIFNILAAVFKAFWGIVGAFLLAKVETNSTWFAISIMIMDLILLMYIIPFVWGVLICLQQCCCPNKQQKKHGQKYANLDNQCHA